MKVAVINNNVDDVFMINYNVFLMYNVSLRPIKTGHLNQIQLSLKFKRYKISKTKYFILFEICKLNLDDL